MGMDRKSGALAVIPARFASTRLPGKPLLDRTGRPLIAHVIEAVRRASRVACVVVATDDARIADAARAAGAEARMTRADHPNGTHRVGEVADALPEFDRILNLQGDEPGLTPEMVDRLVALLDGAEMATLATELESGEAAVPDRVKVMIAPDGFASDFTRAVRPGALLHLGAYGFQRAALRRYLALPPTAREREERLEQLRAVENGIRIAVGVVPRLRFGGIDTAEDYDAFVRAYARGSP